MGNSGGVRSSQTNEEIDASWCPYDIEVHQISDSPHGPPFTEVTIPALGRYAAIGVGDTLDEAMAMLRNVYSFLFNSHGTSVPLPCRHYVALLGCAAEEHSDICPYYESKAEPCECSVGAAKLGLSAIGCVKRREAIVGILETYAHCNGNLSGDVMDSDLEYEECDCFAKKLVNALLAHGRCPNR